MGGTRFKARGVDDEGNVANQVEIEQIVLQHVHHNPPIPITKSSGTPTSELT